MPLKNYTSGISADRSISYIEAKLAGHKATQILKIYSPEGTVDAICFIARIGEVDMPFRLPCQVAAVERTLRANMRRPRPETLRKIGDQARRTAWKILADWIDAQMAMIELSQVELMEVFLPYVYDHGRQQTYFQSIKEHGFKALLPAAAPASR